MVWLVVLAILKNMKVSWDGLPDVLFMENEKCSKPPTRYITGDFLWFKMVVQPLYSCMVYTVYIIYIWEYLIYIYIMGISHIYIFNKGIIWYCTKQTWIIIWIYDMDLIWIDIIAICITGVQYGILVSYDILWLHSHLWNFTPKQPDLLGGEQLRSCTWGHIPLAHWAEASF